MIDTAKLTALACHAQDLARTAKRVRGADRSPAAAAGTWRITNADTDRAEVFVYGAIGDWYGDVNAADFVKALADITAPAIDLRVNSPGGLVFDAVAIYTALQEHSARVDVRIEGIAASAASFIAQAGDTIAIAKPARMMIHDAQGFTMGGPAEHREMLELLDDLSDMIAEIYADRAGGTVADWREPMQATTWYTSAAAVESGLADTITGAGDDDGDEDAGGPSDRATQLLRARARVTLGMST
jgi:ATP-dependent protease ClpP protease subunit